jgi:hypothetical protein
LFCPAIAIIKIKINKVKNFNESAPKSTGNETMSNEGGLKPYRPEDKEEILYQFKYGSVTGYKKPSGIFVDRKIKQGLYEELTKSQQKEIKDLCREIDAKHQAKPKMSMQEAVNSIIK